MITFNVLKTPLDIFNSAKEFFSEAEASITIEPQVKMTLKLSPYAEPLVLTNAIDKEKFSEMMSELFKRIQIMRLANSPQKHFLDVNRFSLMNPLSDWQKFQRVMYEKNGHRCIDMLMSYLGNSNEGCLPLLGLAHYQVDDNPTENDLSYFREVAEKCRFMRENKQLIGTNLQKYYPRIYQLIINEEAHRNVQVGKQTPSFYLEILAKIKESVLGQENAVKQMASILASQKNTEDNQVYLFVGPSGVGKTELAKAVSKIKNRMINFSMNLYQEEIDITKFFGAAPGYSGSTDKPPLAKELDACNPVFLGIVDNKESYEVRNIVILFDEFEKAHFKIKQSLLTIFDEYFLDFSYTREGKNVSINYQFKSCIIINTSNLYQSQILKAFQEKNDDIVALFKKLNLIFPLPTSYSQELMARMNIVPFAPIPSGECYQSLIKMKLNLFFKKIKMEFDFKDIDTKNESLILSILEDKLYGDGTDIRCIPRFFLEIKTIINETTAKWGDLKKIKLTFFCDQGNVFIKISTFIDAFDIYKDIDVPIYLC